MGRLLLCACLLFAAAVADADWYTRSASKMGTRIELRLWHEDPATAERLLEAGLAEVDRIEAEMSTYRDSSALSRVNREAASGPVKVSAELYGLLQRSLELSRLSGGAFDISYDSVGQLYDFRKRRHPDAAEIAARLPAIDYRAIELLPDHQVAFARPGLRVNLGGIAKGYTVETIVARWREAGVRHALATAGGDTRLLGDKRGKPWIVGIRDPDDEQGLVTRLALVDEAISTSGDYERFFDDGGLRYHHILDPASGDSARSLRSASVIGPDATMTDGLSTAVFVLGPDRGLALIDSLPDYEAVLVLPDHSVRVSRGLAGS